MIVVNLFDLNDFLRPISRSNFYDQTHFLILVSFFKTNPVKKTKIKDFRSHFYVLPLQNFSADPTFYNPGGSSLIFSDWAPLKFLRQALFYFILSHLVTAIKIRYFIKNQNRGNTFKKGSVSGCDLFYTTK